MLVVRPLVSRVALRTRPYASRAVSYGQPLPQSHPHILSAGQLTPGIPAIEYEQRRQKLMHALPDDSIVVSVAAPMKYMSGKIFYKYRQASDFWYLTGVEEPDSAVILEKTSSSRGYRMTLFLRGKDSHQEKWEGARTSLMDAQTVFSADDVLVTSELQNHLCSLVPLYCHIYVDVPEPSSLLFPSSSFLQRGNLPRCLRSSLLDQILKLLGSRKRRSLAAEVGRLRAVKTKSEQKVMRAAADISANAHTKTMRFARPGISEASLAAHFEYICALSGSQRPAYVPVVAFGKNALTIHYVANNHLLRDGGLVLVDAGCEYNGYASDITRTYPISGTFTTAQSTLYAAILSVQKSLIVQCKIARHSLASLHRKSLELLKDELTAAGFVLNPGDLEGSLYEHYVGHSIGIDLHESAYFDRNSPLQEGMVITIEPGVYVPPSAAFPRHFHNMGIRIEDEILITKGGPVILSAHAPKEIADVEGACQGTLGLEAY